MKILNFKLRIPTLVNKNRSSDHRVLANLSTSYPRLEGTYQGVTNSFAGCFCIATKAPLTCMPYPRRQRSS